METPKTDPELGPLANKLRNLRYLKRRPDKQPYDIGEIAEAVSRLYAKDNISATRQELPTAGRRPGLLTRQYMGELLKGKRRNPTKDVLQYLAIFFEVSPAYFFEGDERTPETIAVENEVDMWVAARELTSKMRAGGQRDAGQLVVALMRGMGQLDARTATGMLHMHLAAIERAREGDGESLPS
ncbi:hypothetical protein ACH4S8_37750 [Streptomyces sp. NPDC021080]|uniref:hypothetical protein n=1 Tax=Streptomyces sp. NPDC021080 TaxID=3365110 RepID=UPI00378E0556